MQAGHCIMRYFATEMLIEDKGFGYEKSDLVTQADQHAQKIIESLLFDFNSNIAFLAEENGHHSNEDRFEKPYFWSIDPLDGTKAFINQQNGFAVSIGLIEKNGNPIFGVCYFPYSNNLYWGFDSKVQKNDEKITIPDKSKQIRILLSEAESLPKIKNQFYHDLCDLLTKEYSIQKIKAETFIAPVDKAIKVIDTNIPTIYYGLPRAKLGVSVWDFAAVSAIAKHAKIHCTDMFGNPLELNRVDSTFMHHNGFLMSTHQEYADAVMHCFKTSNYVVN